MKKTKKKVIGHSDDLIKLIDRKNYTTEDIKNNQQNKIINNNQKRKEDFQPSINNNQKINNNISNNTNIIPKINNNKNQNQNINNNISINNNNNNNQKIIKKTTNADTNFYSNNNIITILRVRPESEEEKNYSNINIIKIESSTTMKLISPIEYNSFIEGSKYLNNETGIEVTQTKEYIYKFDYIFGQNSQQNEVYQYSTSFLVNNMFEGFNSTIFAYGSTGAGKTYTMFGTGDKPGIIVRTINQILNTMDRNGFNSQYDLQMSYFEIYNESVYDLFSAENKNNIKKKKLAENSISNRDDDLIKISNNKKNNNNKFFLMGITKKIIKSQNDAYEILLEANKNRSRGVTSHNINSSRSHAVLQINIINKITNIKNNNNLNNINLIEEREKTKFGKFMLVDLAGTEKVAEIKPNTDNFYINKSIFTLTNCINGLIHNKNSYYIPWRDSKLTRILKEPLSGNSKVVMIANISPSLMVIDDTYNTLNFAKKIKLVKTNAQKNSGNQIFRIDKFDSVIQDLKNQISMVKNELKQQEQETSILYNEEQNENEDIVNYNSEDRFNEVFQENIKIISEHFQKEIEINKKINEIDIKISNIKNENYFNELNNNISKHDIESKVKKLNDYQIEISNLYNKRQELIRKRANIQLLINRETKKDKNNMDNNNGIGNYLMYVYNYYINLINQLQYKNRKNKIDNDIARKDNQIQNLNAQIQLRDDYLRDIKIKNGNNNITYNLKSIIDIEELNLDPCIDVNLIERNNNLEQFANNIISGSTKQTMKRNISMPFLRNQVQILKKSNNNKSYNNMNNKINNSLPIIQKSSYFDKSKKLNTINNDSSSSIVKKRIPSGYLLRNQRRKLNNLKANLFGQYKKYYNLYHISNNYHVGNFNAGNPGYVKLNNFKKKVNYRNNSLDFESDYNNKVRTLLKKNYIFRYNNSPYSLDNI